MDSQRLGRWLGRWPATLHTAPIRFSASARSTAGHAASSRRRPRPRPVARSLRYSKLGPIARQYGSICLCDVRACVCTEGGRLIRLFIITSELRLYASHLRTATTNLYCTHERRKERTRNGHRWQPQRTDRGLR